MATGGLSKRPATGDNLRQHVASRFVTSNGHATDNYPGSCSGKTSASAEDEVRWPINLTRQYPAAVRGSSVSVFVCSRAKSFPNTKKTQHTQKPQRQKHNKCLTKNSKNSERKKCHARFGHGRGRLINYNNNYI